MSRRRGHRTNGTDGANGTYGGPGPVVFGGAGGSPTPPANPPAAGPRPGSGAGSPVGFQFLFANAEPSRDPALPMQRWDSDWNAAQAPTGLTPETLATQLEDYYAGRFADIARTWEVLERRDGAIAVGRAKRLKKIAAAARECEVVPLEDSPEAERQGEFLTGFYGRLRAESAIDATDRGGFHKAVDLVCDAIGKQYSVLARHYEGEGDALSLTLRHVPLWFFRRDRGGLEVCLTGAIQGEPVDPEQWLVANVGRGVMEPAGIACLWKRLPVRQLVNILERWGRPAIYGKTSAPKGSPGWDELLAALQALIGGWTGVLSGDATIEQVKAQLETATLHMPWIEYCNRELTTLWLHSHLGTTAQGDTGTLAGGAQAEDTADLIAADCVWLQDLFRTQVDAPALLYGLDVEEPLAGIQIQAPQAQDDKADRELVGEAVDRGVTVAVSWYRQRFGLPEPKDGEEVLGQRAAAPGPDGDGQMPPAAGGTRPPGPPGAAAGGKPARANALAPGSATGRVADRSTGAEGGRALANAGGRTDRTGLTDRPDRGSGALTVSVPELAVPEGWGAPVAAVLEEMQRRAADPAIPDGELLAWLREQAARLPELAKAMDVDGLAASLEAGMRAAVDGTVKTASGE